MANWIYFASKKGGTEAETFRLAFDNHVICRTSRKSKIDALIPHVGDLNKADLIFLVYRDGNKIARVCARIAHVEKPSEGTKSIQQIGGGLELELKGAGAEAFQATEGRIFAEVIPLEEVTPCEIRLHGEYGGHNAIHEIDPADRGAINEYVALIDASTENSDETFNAIGSPVAVGPVQREVAVPPNVLEASRIQWTDLNRQPLFDAYLMIDWSSRRAPVRGADSIWIASGVWQDGELVEDSENCYTRHAAMQRISELLFQWDKAGKRSLVGFDFAFGYPAGFANVLGLNGDVPAWEAVWRHFAEHVNDTDANVHNRDPFAAECNAQIANNANENGPGPFWGCPRGAVVPGVLHTTRVGDFVFPHRGLSQWRQTENAAQQQQFNPQSVWKINQGVAVGGQTIMGIKHVAALRFMTPQLQGKLQVWPFETDWTPGVSPVVIAEIFPSAVNDPNLAAAYRDLRQVRSCVRHAAQRDANGMLEGAFDMPELLGADNNDAVLNEEGWILFL